MIVEGLLAEAVAGREQHPAPRVVQREGEHAVQVFQASRPPLVVGGQEHLGIRLGLEVDPKRCQLRAQLDVVVDLPVVDDLGA